MKEKNSFNFIIGLLIGALVAMLIWYWQKSTRAEDGALALLDRLKETERRVRELRMGETAVSAKLNTYVAIPPTPVTTQSTEDLKQVKGIGPVFEERLQNAGVTTFAGLAALSIEQLAEILDIRLGRAESILAEAGNI